MIPALRKRHKIIWLMLAILLPAAFILAYRAIPVQVHQAELFRPDPAPIGEIRSSEEIDQVEYRLRSTNGLERQIEIILRAPLTHASNRLEVKGYNFGDVYVDVPLGGQGIYRYSWTDSVELGYQVRLLDRIKGDVIHKTDLHLGQERIDQ